MKPLTRKQLDQAQCGCCDGGLLKDCDSGEAWIHPRCHPKAGTWACYRAKTGTFEISCRICDAVVCEIKVAEE